MTEFVWTTEMSDPKFSWPRVHDLIEKGEPVILYTKAPPSASIMALVKKRKNVALGITVTGWGGTWLEPGVEKTSTVIEAFNSLVSDTDVRDRVSLRVDPVVPTTLGFARAAYVLSKLERPTKVVCSTLQYYKGQDKVFNRLGIDMSLYTVRSQRALYPSKEIADIWVENFYSFAPDGSKLQMCGMPYEVTGVENHKGCVDRELLAAMGVKIFKEISSGKQRPGCKCIIKKKQAASGRCHHGCLYCYAHKENMAILKNS